MKIFEITEGASTPTKHSEVKFSVSSESDFEHGFTVSMMVDDKPAGSFRYYMDFDDGAQSSVEIHSDYRRRGYGTLLLLKAIETAVDQMGEFQSDIRGITSAQEQLYHKAQEQGLISSLGLGTYDITDRGLEMLNQAQGLTEGSQNSVEIHSGISHAYHVTPVENLSSILQNGLRPSVGTRSSKIKDEQSGIYLFPDLNSVSDAISNWLGDEFDDETELALLKINIRGLEKHISSSVGYELVINKPISPNRISVSSELDLTESASGYIPSNKEKNDPRFKMGLTVDIKPDSIQKNAKALGSKISRAGIPPQARTDGKI